MLNREIIAIDTVCVNVCVQYTHIHCIVSIVNFQVITNELQYIYMYSIQIFSRPQGQSVLPIVRSHILT